MSKNSSNPVVANVEISTDEHGRFNLNALHKAHLAQNPGLHRNSKQPADWLKLDGTKDLITAISNSEDLQICPIESKPGRYGGTFAHELLAVSYAGWISPQFQLTVNQTFIDYRSGKLDRPAIPQTLAEALRLAADQAEELEQTRPKVVAFDRIATSRHGSVCVTDAAKALGIKRCVLTDYLLTHGWCYRRAGRRSHLVAYQRAIEASCLEHKVTSIDTTDGPRTVHQVLVTPKGLTTLAQKIGTQGPNSGSMVA